MDNNPTVPPAPPAPAPAAPAPAAPAPAAPAPAPAAPAPAPVTTTTGTDGDSDESTQTSPQRPGTPIPRFETTYDDTRASPQAGPSNPAATAFQGIAVPGSEMSPDAAVFLERIPRDTPLARELAENLLAAMSQWTNSMGVYFPMEFTQRILENLCVSSEEIGLPMIPRSWARQVILEMNEIQAAMHRDRGLPPPNPFRFRNEDWNNSDFANQPGAEELNKMYQTRAPYVQAPTAPLVGQQLPPQPPPSTPSNPEEDFASEEPSDAGPSTSRAPYYRHCEHCVCWLMEKMLQSDAVASESSTSCSDEEPTITQDAVSRLPGPAALREFEADLEDYQENAGSESEEPDAAALEARRKLKGKDRALE